MADADTRPATPSDAGELARIQLSTWRAAYAEILPAGVLAGLDSETVTGRWREAIEHGLVFVATEGVWLVGFAAAGPAPEAESAGAALRAAGCTRGIAWVAEADRASLSFYRRAGWQPDGTVRTLDAGGRPL